jgi:uncharacterized protein
LSIYYSIAKAILFWIVFIFFLYIGGSSPLQGFVPAEWESFSYGVIGTIAAIITTILFLKFEKASFRDIGLVWESKTVYRFLIGIAIGTILLLLVILLLLGLTDLQLQRSNRAIAIKDLAIYLAFIPLALGEEIGFRSYPLLKLNNAVGLRVTQWIVAIAFAMYHMVYGWDFKVAMLGPGTWAFIFGLAAVWSRGIAIPTGIHAALNMGQAMLGMKGDNGSLLTLKYPDGVAATAIKKTETAGVVIQLFVLLLGILLTEYYLRKHIRE